MLSRKHPGKTAPPRQCGATADLRRSGLTFSGADRALSSVYTKACSARPLCGAGDGPACGLLAHACPDLPTLPRPPRGLYRRFSAASGHRAAGRERLAQGERERSKYRVARRLGVLRDPPSCNPPPCPRPDAAIAVSGAVCLWPFLSPHPSPFCVVRVLCV